MSCAQSFLVLCLLWMHSYWQPHLFNNPNKVGALWDPADDVSTP